MAIEWLTSPDRVPALQSMTIKHNVKEAIIEAEIQKHNFLVLFVSAFVIFAFVLLFGNFLESLFNE